jgi:hypothetical protein
MKHRWKSAVLALLLAGLLCVSLTACELEGDGETVNPFINISGISGTDNWVSDSAGEVWTVTRTRKEDDVKNALDSDGVYLYQIEVKAATKDEAVSSVSLQYVIKADSYWDKIASLGTEALEAENTLEKKTDTDARRYVLITYEYDADGANYDTKKVTVRYGTELSKETPLSGVIYETVYSFYKDGADIKLKYESGVKIDEKFDSDTTRSPVTILNAALNLIRGKTTANSEAAVEASIKTLAGTAHTTGASLLSDTYTARGDQVKAKQEEAGVATSGSTTTKTD